MAERAPDLPAEPIDEGEWQGLHPAALTVWRLAGVAPAVLIGVGAAVALLILGSAAGAVVAVGIAVASAGLWWRLVGGRWKAWGYKQREQDLVIRRGVLVRRLTIVPYGRMQFVDVKQGPLARALGVSTIQLHTAAAATDASIPFLADEDAARLRDRLTRLGEAHAAGL